MAGRVETGDVTSPVSFKANAATHLKNKTTIYVVYVIAALDITLMFLQFSITPVSDYVSVAFEEHLVFRDYYEVGATPEVTIVYTVLHRCCGFEQTKIHVTHQNEHWTTQCNVIFSML